jgi:ADP-ribosylglycohydrolase
MTDKRKAMVLGSFTADALALGVHWVYNTRVIDKKFGVVEQYHDPLTSYHTGKKRGDFTHYGDQMLVLLASVDACKGFDLDHFADAWQSFFATYQGYFDKATKATLQNLSEGKSHQTCGSSSEELAGASRISPLVYVNHRDFQQLIHAARLQTAFTHNTDSVIDSAEFFSRTAVKVLTGRTPSEAIAETVDDNYKGHVFEEYVALGLQSAQKDTREAIAEFGQMCELEAAFPATIHIILKYEDDFKRGMVENVMAGGDSAGRGMMAGMILGAHGGMDAIPEKWLKELTHHDRILASLESLDKK